MEIIGLTNQIPQISNSNINTNDIKDWVHEQGFLKEHQDISHLITEEKLKQESDKTFKVIDITNWFQDLSTQEGEITEKQFNTLLEYDGIIIHGEFIIRDYTSTTDDYQLFYKDSMDGHIDIGFDKSSLFYFIAVQYRRIPTMSYRTLQIEKLSSGFLTANGALDPDQDYNMELCDFITVEVNNFGIFQFQKTHYLFPYIEFVGLVKANDWIKFYCLTLDVDTHSWSFYPIDIQIDITNQLTQLVTLEQRIATLENIVAQLTNTSTNE